MTLSYKHDGHVPFSSTAALEQIFVLSTTTLQLKLRNSRTLNQTKIKRNNIFKKFFLKLLKVIKIDQQKVNNKITNKF